MFSINYAVNREVREMTEQQIFEKIKELIIKQMSLKNANIAMDTRLVKDLGADSVDLVGSVMTIEDVFGLSIPDEDLENIETVGDVVKVVAKNL